MEAAAAAERRLNLNSLNTCFLVSTVGFSTPHLNQELPIETDLCQNVKLGPLQSGPEEHGPEELIICEYIRE